MKYLHSIQPLDKNTIVESQDRPLIISCEGLKDYYAKYNRPNNSVAFRLFKEYLAACFLKLWEFKQPNYCFINVRKEDLPTDLTIPKKCFSVPSFGIEKIEESIDLNKITEELLVKSKRKFKTKEDLLKLAFFDIWLSNEDRHSGNFNILCKYDEKGYDIYPIDHAAIFNHGILNAPIDLLTFDETLINSNLFSKLLIINMLKVKRDREGIRKKYYLYAENCKKNINNILKYVPPEWKIDILDVEEKLIKYILNDTWFDNCWNQYLLYFELLKKVI